MAVGGPKAPEARDAPAAAAIRSVLSSPATSDLLSELGERSAWETLKLTFPAALPDPVQCFPALGWLRRIWRGSPGAVLAQDMVCGVTVAAVLIPQAMAYGLLAGLPPVYGLYTALLPAVAYTVFGTCMHLSVGPFALISMLTCQGIELLVPDPHADPEAAVAVASTLSLLVGVELLLFGVMQLGFLAGFLSDPVLSGFCTASSLIIPASQLKYAFQVQVRSGGFFGVLRQLLEGVAGGAVNAAALAIFAASLAALLAIQRLNRAPPARLAAALRRFPLPAELSVVVLSTAAGALGDLGASPGPAVHLLGPVPPGLPALSLPTPALHEVRVLLAPSLVIALMTYVVSMSVSKSFGRRFGYDVNNDQELVALGAANLLGAVSCGYPAAASMSRTAIAAEAGAASPLHGLVTAAAASAVLMFCTSWVATLPLAALAAIVVMAFKSLLLDGFAECQKTWRASCSCFVVWQIAFWATLTQDVTRGLACAVAADMLHLVYKTTRPSHSVLGRVEGSEHMYCNFRNDSVRAVQVPGVLIFRWNGPLHFANRDFFFSALWRELLKAEEGAPPAAGPAMALPPSAVLGLAPAAGGRRLLDGCIAPGKVHAVTLDASPIVHIDMSACRTLDKLRRELRARGTRLVIGHCNFECTRKMEDMGLFERAQGEDEASFDLARFRDLHDAVRHAESQGLAPAPGAAA